MKFSPLQMKINPDATTKKWKNKITKTKHKQNQKQKKDILKIAIQRCVQS
jgi:hypothetical protein